MSAERHIDALLIERIRSGEAAAWEDLIARYEGRLLAFVEVRLRDRAAAEDVVQETFIGLLTSLPHYDGSRHLEGYLFTIAAHKLTDHLRRSGRRPALSLSSTEGSQGENRAVSPEPALSSCLRSRERQQLEEQALVTALAQIIEHWRQRGDWHKLMTAELLFVAGLANQAVARRLKVTEQQVATVKFECLRKLQQSVRAQGLSSDVFPELAEVEG